MTSFGSHLSHLIKRRALAERSQQALAHAVLAWRWDDAAREAAALDGGVDMGKTQLAGLITSVKANVDVAGWTTTAGSFALVNEPPAVADAPLVGTLRRAGALVVAQTNMVEFAYGALGQNRHFGTPYSPAYPGEQRLAGGSSSGAAVTVATGVVDAALGTDTSGSVRIPAALCGVVGFKPTQGRYPSHGIVPLSRTLDTAGFLTRSVELCIQLDSAVTGQPNRISTMRRVEYTAMRFAVPRRFISTDVGPDAAASFEKALSRLCAAGCEIRDVEMSFLDEIGEVARSGGIVAVEALSWHWPIIEARRKRYDPQIRSRIAAGANYRAIDYLRALDELTKLYRCYQTELEGFDALITPTTPLKPPRLHEILTEADYLDLNKRMMRFTEFANRINVPSITLPIGGAQRDAGMLLTGRRGLDDNLLNLGAAVESVLNSKAGATV